MIESPAQYNEMSEEKVLDHCNVFLTDTAFVVNIVSRILTRGVHYVGSIGLEVPT